MNTAPFFDYYYKNAEVNSIVIMEPDGTVLDVNRAFTNHFGYDSKEIAGQNFSILFTKPDIDANKPGMELKTVATKGQSHDENYVVNKQGHSIWCTGESMWVVSEGKNYIIKDIINLQAKKQLQLFLRETEELLERIFESSHEIPMLILDGGIKIQKVNAAFLHLFDIGEAPPTGSSLSALDHHLWNTEEIKNDLRKILVNNQPLKQKHFTWTTASGEKKMVRLDSKIIDSHATIGRKIFIILEDVSQVAE